MITDAIIVTNGNKGLALKGRYAGRDYTFPPGEPVPLPRPAAAHIFGYGLKDKHPAMLRMGILKPLGELDPATGRSIKTSAQLLAEAHDIFNNVTVAQARLEAVADKGKGESAMAHQQKADDEAA